MSVLYRALWSDAGQDDPFAYLDRARALFSSWATEDPQAAPLPYGTTTVELPGGRRRTISLREVEADFADDARDDEGSGLVGIEGVTQDTRTDDDPSGTTFTTVVRVVTDVALVHVWVENRVETDDLRLRVKVGRPRVVDDLLAIPGKPRLGG